MLPYLEIHGRWCEKLYSAWCRKCCLEKECYFDLVKSSRLQHEESQLKKWRVMEMDRMIWSDKRLYTIGKISEGLIFFFIDCISTFFLKTAVANALYSFLFDKHVIFYYIFLKKNFSFSLKVHVYKLLTNFMFYFYLLGWFSCYSIASAKLWLAQQSSCPAISCSWAATRLASMTASLVFLGLLFEVFQ